jgi:hypothetical protein
VNLNTDSALEAWYKLDDGSGMTAVDSSGNSRTLSLSGMPGWLTTAKIGGGLNLNGDDDRGERNAVDYTGLTFAAWVRLDETTNRIRFVNDATGEVLELDVTQTYD